MAEVQTGNSPISEPVSPTPDPPSTSVQPIIAPSPSPGPVPSPNATPTKQGRRPTFTHQDDLIIVREVAAAQAHIAPFGEVLKRFTTAAEKANANPNLSAKLVCKRLQDRYKKLMETFEKKDASERMMSGVGGEVGELEDLLSAMLDAQKDLKASKDAEKMAKTAQEDRKEEVGRALRENAMKRREGSAGNESVSLDGKVGKGRGKCRRLDEEGDEGLSSLAASLKETDMARIDVERERLALEREKMAVDAEERSAERDMRREERAARDKLELEKFRLMMDTFASARK